MYLHTYMYLYLHTYTVTYIWLFVYTYTSICIYIYIHVYIYIYIRIYIYTYTYIYIYILIYIYTYIYIYIYIRKYIYIHIYKYDYICMYIYIHICDYWCILYTFTHPHTHIIFLPPFGKRWSMRYSSPHEIPKIRSHDPPRDPARRCDAWKESAHHGVPSRFLVQYGSKWWLFWLMVQSHRNLKSIQISAMSSDCYSWRIWNRPTSAQNLPILGLRTLLGWICTSGIVDSSCRAPGSGMVSFPPTRMVIKWSFMEETPSHGLSHSHEPKDNCVQMACAFRDHEITFSQGRSHKVVWEIMKSHSN